MSRTPTITELAKYVELPDSYLSVSEAIRHAAANNSSKVKIKWIDSDDLSSSNINSLGELSGVIVPGGFGERGISGMIEAAKFCR